MQDKCKTMDSVILVIIEHLCAATVGSAKIRGSHGQGNYVTGCLVDYPRSLLCSQVKDM